MSELPEELLEEILCRVPAPSLKRLRSTCKRWNSLFDDRRFARKHSDKATKQSLILLCKEPRVCSVMRSNLHRFSPGKLTLTDLHSSLDQTEICEVSQCNGLLLCLTKYNTRLRLVVWNPCTGQTRWIINRPEPYTIYALGSYQDKKSNDSISYKILSRRVGYHGYKICEINSNSWRTLDVVDFSLFGFHNRGVSLKGKTYWVAKDEEERQHGMFLVSFDYTTERFERLFLPRQFHSHHVSLSLVREEKFSVLLQRGRTSKTEIWVTNKFGDETKVVSWSMVLVVDLGHGFETWNGGSFWIDEEKKVLVYCDNLPYKGKIRVRIVGEDNKVKQVDFEPRSRFPFMLNYVPSLIQI